MQMTLLEMTQDILSSLGSDEVNSISDTTESMQVATCIKTVYNNIVSRADLPEMNQFFQLTASNDDTLPTLMYCPQGVSQIDWIKYFSQDNTTFTDQYGAYSHDLNLDLQNNSGQNGVGQAYTSLATAPGNAILYFSTVPSWVEIGQTVSDVTNALAIPANTTVIGLTAYTVTLSNNVVSPGVSAGDNIFFSPVTNPLFYREVKILSISDFIHMIDWFNPLEGDVCSYQFQNMNLRYKNDKVPQYCTVIQNFYVLFDSYDSTVDSTLQSAKSMCWGQMLPVFLMQDDFIPDVDDKQVPLLYNEAKALAFVELKQTVNPKAEQEAKRGWSSLQKTKSFTDKPTYFDQFANFGRRPQTGGYALYRRFR
jgi:hypothetical protein